MGREGGGIMTEWEDLLPDIAESFGGTFPHPDAHERIKAAYLRAPKSVLRQIDRVTAEYHEGGVRSPWGMLHHRVKDIQQDTERAEKVVSRDKALERAEQWIRNAGLMYDRQEEILDELFGAQGMMRTHDTPDARLHLLLLWRELRPTGELIEHEADARGQRYQDQRKELACPASRPTSAPNTSNETEPTSPEPSKTTNT